MERKIGKLDYPRLENMIEFYYREDLYKAINKLGFELVSECIAKLYYGQGLSCRAIAEFLPIHAHTINRWMAIWGMSRREHNNCGNPWRYGKHCADCGVVTTAGYRALGRCWPCYMALKRREAH